MFLNSQVKTEGLCKFADPPTSPGLVSLATSRGQHMPLYQLEDQQHRAATETTTMLLLGTKSSVCKQVFNWHNNATDEKALFQSPHHRLESMQENQENMLL